MFVGVTAPLLFALVFVALVFANGGNEDLTPQPPQSDVAGACVDATPSGVDAPPCSTSVSAIAPTGVVVQTATAVPPTATPAPRSYTVQAGDTLSLICAAEVPEMPIDTCVAAVVSLSDLGGPDEIVEGQTLRLPADTAATPTTSTRPAVVAKATRTPQVQAAVTDLIFETESSDDEDEVSEDTTEEGATDDDDSSPSASLVALGPDGLPPSPTPTATATAMPTATPVPTLPPGFVREDATLYTVQPGDSLLTICAEQVPQYSVPDCVYLVVELNDLQGPDQVYAHQGLLLP